MIRWILLVSLLMNFSAREDVNNVTFSSEQVVEKVVIQFFDAMRGADGDQIRSLTTDDATLHTVTELDEKPTLRETNFGDFIGSVSQSERGTLDEQLISLTVHQDGNLATAWMEYRFYVAGEFSHCGVNTMNLIHKEDGWKIFSIVDTRQQEGCDE